MQVDRRCGSGLQAVLQACMQVATGVGELIVAGGVESMSQAEFYTVTARWGVRGTGVQLEERLAWARVTAGGAHYQVPGGMIETAETFAPSSASDAPIRMLSQCSLISER